MKNKERFKRYILSFIGVIISFLIVFIIISRLEYQGYRKNFNYKVNAMIEVIRNKYPDVSPEEVMELLNSNSLGKEDSIGNYEEVDPPVIEDDES